MAHGEAGEGKWRRTWRMEWVAITLHTTLEHCVSSIRVQLKRDGTWWRTGKWRGNWWMEWVGSTLHTTSELGVSSITTSNLVYPALLPLMRTPRLPVADWTDAPADLNGLVRFAERRNLVSARVLSHFNWPLQRAILYSGCRALFSQRYSDRADQSPV